ncbi:MULTISPECIES: MarR family transcriptional regulator [unclassified Paenibacillus]|uniref:MarR family winged helix-turn-helix transcriptional regulator n=1 Tax=unclassified Paenibacillus TaxID=185978 RepID=UPI00104ACAFA|nr:MULTISPECIES: MarR family transcriptional regulator [unclassified Paenibacillus]NIK69751.1 DNA-binding MarR family transcriptional regulator [Paenibacillus sp. BK720]TCM97587.1 MarR family transcriptional regulator [Paenibacillus sp. BK033]
MNLDQEKLLKLREMDDVFRKLRRLINAEYNRFNVHGLGMTEGKMVIILAQHGPQKASAMAEWLRITSGAVTGISDRLIDLGYVERSRSEYDRRIVMLSVTDEGRKLVDHVMEMRERIMFKLYDGFELDDIEKATDIFMRMAANLDPKSDATEE